MGLVFDDENLYWIQHKGILCNLFGLRLLGGVATGVWKASYATFYHDQAWFGPPPYTDFMLDYEISPVDAADLLRQNKVRFIDVREPWEFATAHIEGSVAMPMGDVPARANQELDPDERLVVLCHLGQRSMNVTVWLRNQGFEQVQSLRGGIDAWSAEVDPKVARY